MIDIITMIKNLLSYIQTTNLLHILLFAEYAVKILFSAIQIWKLELENKNFRIFKLENKKIRIRK